MDGIDDSWTPVRGGASGAAILRRGDQFAKRGDVADEAARLAWLQGRLRVPSIVSAAPGLLITSALHGVPAAELAATRLPSVMRRALELVAALPIAACPFRAPMAALVEEAAARVSAGLVDEDNFDDARRGRAPAALLEELAATRPTVEELAVCHGDLCPDNVIVDGDEIGFVDVGRLAVTDRHRDLALVLRELPALSIAGVDPARIAWFQLLDEFF